MNTSHIVVGGGSAGAVLAARLSEKSSNSVVLLEAGRDFGPGETPPELVDAYARRVFSNPDHFWRDLNARRVVGDDLPPRARLPTHYEQARLIGGGSSINGQVGLRGSPQDYDRWHELGATGWDWASVLPFFRKIERDVDFQGPLHGSEGPIPVERIPRERWDKFTVAVTNAWARRGYRFNPDMNGPYEDGYSPLPLTTQGGQRVSTAIGYLTPEVRRRPNLRVVGGARVQRLVFEGTRVTGVEFTHAAGTSGGADATTVQTMPGNAVVVCAGAIHSPWLLMISGIGPAAHLRDKNVAVVADRPGVGGHLLEHPSIMVSSYLPADMRDHHPYRTFVYLRYSSGLPGGSQGDMMMGAVSKFSWHAIGERLGTLSCYVAKSYSEGTVRLASPSTADEPDVCFNWLSDLRDRQRLIAAFRTMASILATEPVSGLTRDPFPTSYSDRARRLQPETPANRILTRVGAALMDGSPALRRFLIRNLISDGPDLRTLLEDDDALETYVRGRVTSAWHPCGSCRMGSAADPMSVTDPQGMVIGVQNLYVADASVFPEITRGNTNLPAIMVAERVADMLKAR